MLRQANIASLYAVVWLIFSHVMSLSVKISRVRGPVH